jgi:anthranilate synthase component 1
MPNFNTHIQTRLADTITPVSVYLAIRDLFPNSLLLESSDYHGNEDIYSYICCQAIESVVLNDHQLSFYSKEKLVREEQVSSLSLPETLEKYITSFKANGPTKAFQTAGFFGYTTYDSVRHFEDIQIRTYTSEERAIPDLRYAFYRFMLVFNHASNELHLIENVPEGEVPDESTQKRLWEACFGIIAPQTPFSLKGQEESNVSDEEFIELIRKGKAHCSRGDVFQIVLSRRFKQDFAGDDFNVYRSLRSINPSPYLFYFDFGTYRIFGSSPEAQIVVKQGKAIIYPIAGTFRRTGNDIQDYDLAMKLLEDPKENAEHVMLVDLARNDLSRHCHNVKVETYKEVQYYSHVIHLVSKVVGELDHSGTFMQIVADTFPAGTLSGAPKHQAMKLIDTYEKDNRGFYGGAIGFIGLNGEFNHAIMIRSMLSKGQSLFYQAGAGVVFMSDEKSESQEVHNKLAALRRSLELAQQQ